MTGFSYKTLSSNVRTRIAVYLDGRRLGEIKGVLGGFAYYPKGSHHCGPTFSTVERCKASIEAA